MGKQASDLAWREKNVLVTGASGIVGSHLVKALLKVGANVVVLLRDADPQSELLRSGDIQRVSVVSGQLEDYLTLERAVNEREIETVFHLGAQPIVGAAQRSPLQTFEANIRGTYNLLEACRVHKDLVKRVVVASSDKAYGTQEKLPYTEDTPLTGRYPYEVSKSCTDLLSQSYFHSFGLPVTIARCGNIFGGGDLNWSRIVPGTIRSLLKGESPIIRCDGKFVRDYIYVEDVVRAYMKLAEQMDRTELHGEAFNFSPEMPLSVLQVVEIVSRAMNCEHHKPIIQNKADGEIKDQYLSATKARQLLAWTPEFSIEEAMELTIDWYQKFFSSDERSATLKVRS